MMNLQKKSFSLGVVALLLWALALAFTISWLLNREIVPLLQPGAVVRWPQLTLLIYLTIFTITACVGLPMVVLAYHWLFRPWQQLAEQFNRPGGNDQRMPRLEVNHSTAYGQLAQKINDLAAHLEISAQRAQQYRWLIQQEPASVVLFDATTHRVITANDAFLALTGYSQKSILHCSLYDLCHLSRYELDNWCVALLDHSVMQTRDIALATQSGAIIEAEVSAIYLQGGEHALLGLIVRNVMARRQADATMRYQASLVDSVSDIIVSTDLDLRIISWNQAATKIYGYTLTEVAGRHLREVIHFEFPTSSCDEALALLRATGKWEGEQSHYHRDGSVIQLWSSVAYMYDSEGKPIGMVGVHRNISERKQAERLLPLAQQSEGLRLLAGGIAHDFNNILTSILSQITLGLWQLPYDSKAAEHLTKAARSTERAAELTRQLLAYTGQGAFLVEELHLTAFIQDNCKLLTTLVPSHAQLEWRLQEQSHTTKIDRGHAQQVLINLVINGAEALPLSGGIVLVETGELTLYAEERQTFVRNQTPNPGHYVYLRVSDNGVGMGPAILDRIFDPYYSTKENGSGLGLAATLGIVRHYGGGLQVESREGHGSIFTVLLPTATKRAPDDLAVAPVTPVHTPETGYLPPTSDAHISATVLIVDDEMPIREALYDLLSSEEMHVLLAADGHEAVDLYGIHQKEIDLILLDMKMPGMNGAQTLVALRGINPAVKVIFCSGYSEAEALKSIGDQPVVAFLQKPIDINLLIKTIHNALA